MINSTFSTSTMQKWFGIITGPPTEMPVIQMEMETTADLRSLTITWGLNNANTVGNAEEHVIAKEEDGAQDMMDASELLYQLKHQDYYLITEKTDFTDLFKIYFYSQML